MTLADGMKVIDSYLLSRQTNCVTGGFVTLFVLLYSAALRVLDPQWNLGATRKFKMRIENKRHTSAHQPSPPSQQRRLQSPPLRQISPNYV
jgi:hypothetical protein